jgi:hypothetical protein
MLKPLPVKQMNEERINEMRHFRALMPHDRTAMIATRYCAFRFNT